MSFSTCFQRLRSCNADGMPLAPYMILNYMRIAKVKWSSSNISYYFTQYQKINAQHLSLKGAGILIEEANLSPEAIENEIKLLNSEKIHKISTKLEALKVSNPEQLIADYLLH